MNCLICKQGATKDGTATVTLERGGTTLVLKHVEAEVCENCGEAYLGEATTARLLRAADEAAHGGVQVEIRTLAEGRPVAALPIAA